MMWDVGYALGGDARRRDNHNPYAELIEHASNVVQQRMEVHLAKMRNEVFMGVMWDVDCRRVLRIGCGGEYTPESDGPWERAQACTTPRDDTRPQRPPPPL